MTDIVERLRDDRIDSMSYQRAEAADEIERLRGLLREIADGYGPNHGSKYCRDLALSAVSSTDGKTP